MKILVTVKLIDTELKTNISMAVHGLAYIQKIYTILNPNKTISIGGELRTNYYEYSNLIIQYGL